MVSVVIPVYNGAKYIEKTIHTILNSTYQDIEIIAVVDGSPDNSLAVCQKLSQEDDRVKTFYKENGGISVSVIKMILYNQRCMNGWWIDWRARRQISASVVLGRWSMEA